MVGLSDEDWLQRWSDHRIPFHESRVNPLLLRHASAWNGGQPVERLLVPFCGKSVDMVWLARHAGEIVGVELSALALREFHADNGLQFVEVHEPPFGVFRAKSITTLAGDFFHLTAGRFGRFQAAYDRAALIALPAAGRPGYVDHLLSLLAAGARILLITLEFAPEEMSGPPFPVDRAEVDRLFGRCAAVVPLSRDEVTAVDHPLLARGLSRLHEAAYLITVQPTDD
ncbi:MAG: thiopurine S-methyltransferase [Acidobacteriota bacterium]